MNGFLNICSAASSDCFFIYRIRRFNVQCDLCWGKRENIVLIRLFGKIRHAALLEKEL